MKSFEAIVRHAITLEAQAAEFYQKLVNRTDKAEIKKVFTEMVQQEIGHKKKLELILEKGALPQGRQVTPDEDLKISDYVVEVDPEKENLTYQEALVIGMKMEKNSLRLYQTLAREAEPGEARDLFLYLAEEEAKHKHAFESKFDDLL